MPNRSEARSAQLELELEIGNAKLQQSSDKLQQSSDKPQLSLRDMQLSLGEKEKEELGKWLKCRAGRNFNKRNLEKLQELLEKYGSEYYFNRTTIANAFGISENVASRIIRKSVDCEIMRKEKNGEYYFNM